MLRHAVPRYVQSTSTDEGIQIADLINLSLPTMRGTSPAFTSWASRLTAADWGDAFAGDPGIILENTTYGIVGVILYDSGSSHISFFCIHPDFQGQGMGTELLCSLLDFLKYEDQRSSDRFTLFTTPETAPFYQKNGFELTGKKRLMQIAPRGRQDYVSPPVLQYELEIWF